MVEAGGRSVTITHPDKVFFKQRGETKLDLVEYYRAVEGPIMETIGNRPVLLERYPDLRVADGGRRRTTRILRGWEVLPVRLHG